MVGPVVGPVYGFKPLLCTLNPVRYRDLRCYALLWLETSCGGLIAENACYDCVLDLIVTGRWALWWALVVVFIKVARHPQRLLKTLEVVFLNVCDL